MSDTNVSKTPFKDIQSFVFFVSRANKIASAVYLVTELFDDREPLRWELRKRVLEFVSAMPSTFEEVRIDLEQLMFMLETASRVRLVSNMNKDIIVSEIRSFAEALEAEYKGKTALDSDALGRVFERTEDVPLIKDEPKVLIAPKKSIGHRALVIKDIKKDIVFTAPISGSNGKDRRERIINLIREKNEATIKDIATDFPECSEKTIQRDLVDMVASGDIKKKGERRWTVYFL